MWLFKFRSEEDEDEDKEEEEEDEDEDEENIAVQNTNKTKGVWFKSQKKIHQFDTFYLKLDWIFRQIICALIELIRGIQ